MTQADKLDLRDLGQVVEAAREAVGGGGGARAHVVNKHHWRVGKVQTYKSKSVKKITFINEKMFQDMLSDNKADIWVRHEGRSLIKKYRGLF